MKKNNSHSGFTIIELLIAIGLFTIIITIAVGGFTNALRTQRQVSSLISTQSNVSLALEQMTREIRTSYLFCHDPGSLNTPTVTPSPSCGCTVGDSGYSPSTAGNPSTPYDPSEEYNNGDYPVWTCTDLDYYTADGTEVHYSVKNGELMRNQNNGVAQSITGSNVFVHNLKFILFGNIEGDNWTPRITITMGVSPNSTDPATENDILNLQTTVSARQIDCVEGADAC